jgi:K+-sensing histidine kinase KdpD
MLREGDVPPDAIEGPIRRLNDALGRLAERVLDVELLAGASLGRLQLAPEPTTVGELVSGLPGFEGVDGEGPDVEITVDRALFPRVLRDLWEAGGLRPTPRSLRLEVATVPPWVEVRIVRDADPIDAGVLQALFEPFDLNSDDTGVTIGLYLARALTVAHGGTVGVDQDENGAVLYVRVPRRSAIETLGQ